MFLINVIYLLIVCALKTEYKKIIEMRICNEVWHKMIPKTWLTRMTNIAMIKDKLPLMGITGGLHYL
jgi:hypothetical protein